MFLYGLPNLIIFKIIKILSEKDVINSMMVDKLNFQKICKNEKLWQALVYDKYEIILNGDGIMKFYYRGGIYNIKGQKISDVISTSTLPGYYIKYDNTLYKFGSNDICVRNIKKAVTTSFTYIINNDNCMYKLSSFTCIMDNDNCMYKLLDEKGEKKLMLSNKIKDMNITDGSDVIVTGVDNCRYLSIYNSIYTKKNDDVEIKLIKDYQMKDFYKLSVVLNKEDYSVNIKQMNIYYMYDLLVILLDNNYLIKYGISNCDIYKDIKMFALSKYRLYWVENDDNLYFVNLIANKKVQIPHKFDILEIKAYQDLYILTKECELYKMISNYNFILIKSKVAKFKIDSYGLSYITF